MNPVTKAAVPRQEAMGVRGIYTCGEPWRAVGEPHMGEERWILQSVMEKYQREKLMLATPPA